MPVSQYSSARLAPGTTQGTIADFGNNLPVNFSGQTVDNIPSMFTVGGWVRLLQQPPSLPSSTLFTVQNQFEIQIDTSGIVSAYFVGSTGQDIATSDVSIPDGNWHYIAVSYQQNAESPVANDGVLQIFIDGFQTIAQEVHSSCTQTPGDCSVGLNAPALDITSWAIWSAPVPSDVMDVPDWGTPAVGSEAAQGLVGSWDFANGTAQDQSPNNNPVTVAQQYWHTTCLPANIVGLAPNSADNIAPGAGGPFSVMGWVYCPTTPSSTVSIFSATGASGQGGFVLNLTRGDGEGQILLNDPIQVWAPTPSAQWTHVALTYDGTTISLYINGTLSTEQGGTVPEVSSPTVAIGSQSATAAYLQNLSIWNTCLAASDIQNSYTNDIDPTGAAGCVAYFSLDMDLGNTLTGSALAASNPAATPAITELLTSLTASTLATPRPQARMAAPGDIPLMRVADFKALAARQGIDVTATPDAAAMAAGPYAEVTAWYETLLKGVPPRSAARLRAEFHRNLLIGVQLQEKGIKTGTFEIVSQGDEAIVHYHTEAGPQEVGRLSADAVAAGLQQYIKITIDVVSIVASMFGILTTAAKVTNAVGLFDDLMPAVGTAVSEVSGTSNLQKATNAIFAVIKVLWEWKALFTLIKKIITASWWSLVFTALSLAAQIAGLITTGGWLIAWKVSQMAISIGQLVYDLTHPTGVAAVA